MQASIHDSHDLLDYPAMNKSEPFSSAEVGIAEFVLVETELVQDRGVDVAQMTAILDRTQADGVRGADDGSALDASTGEPHREAEIMVIASSAALRFG